MIIQKKNSVWTWKLDITVDFAWPYSILVPGILFAQTICIFALYVLSVIMFDIKFYSEKFYLLIIMATNV